MTWRHYGMAALILPLLIVGAGQGRAQAPSPPTGGTAPLSAAAIAAGRQQMVAAILTTDMPGVARWSRSSCAFDDNIASVAKARAEGHIMAPDAGDGCIAAMTRQAHDGDLVSLYQDAVNLDLGRSADASPLPLRIAESIQDGSNRIDLGSDHWLQVTPGLALDDGFTTAYWSGRQARQIAADPVRLKALTEECVGQHSIPKLCFAVGYIQGAAAYAAAHPGS